MFTIEAIWQVRDSRVPGYTTEEERLNCICEMEEKIRGELPAGDYLETIMQMVDTAE